MNKIFLTDEFHNKLENKQILDLFKNYYCGDNSARDEIINHHLYLVSNIINHYFHEEKDKEDLMSVGIISLMDAVDTFDIRGKNTFYSHCKKYILRDLQKYVTSEKKRNIVSLREFNDKELIGLNPDLEVTIEELIENREILDNVLSYFNDKEKTILFMFYDGNKTKQIAEKLNMSVNQVQYSLHEIWKKLYFVYNGFKGSKHMSFEERAKLYKR